MADGVCEYKEKQANGAQPYRVLLSVDTIKKMNPSFQGLPLYLNHVDDVEIDKIKEEAVGYVVESFYNEADGKCWAKFMVTDPKGEEYLKKGWKLSNAYVNSGPFGGGGDWHGVSYLKEVLEAKYDHLAIVQSPRYKESIVLSPEEFKQYNIDKKDQHQKLMNSEKQKQKQENKKMKFNFFKKEKMENSADLESMSVILPKSGKEFTIEKMVNEMDEMQMQKGQVKMANGDDKVKIGDAEMSVNELVEKYNSMCMKNSEDEAKKKKDEEEAKAKNSMTDEEKAKNAAAEEEKKKMNSMTDEEKAKNAADEADKKKKDEEEKLKNSAHFEKLKNAAAEAGRPAGHVVETSHDQVVRGAKRYGK